MTTKVREELVEIVASAFRDRDPAGAIKPHPSWYDLDARGRVEAYEIALSLRLLEASLDTAGLSTTARAVLSMIRSDATSRT